MIYKRETSKESDLVMINIGLIYFMVDLIDKHGWVRLFGFWHGIHWKPISSGLIFSERIGNSKYITLFGLNFFHLKPVKKYL